MTKLTKDEEATKQNYDKIASIWVPHHLTPKFWGDELDKFHKHLPKGRILEIGCGGGRDARELTELGYDYIGTDVSTGLLAEARKNNPGVRFEEKSVYDLDFTEKFDGFWCAAVLLHIPKKRIDEALKAIKRNVKIGGVGFIAIKEGDGEKMDHSSDKDGGDRFFAYWQNEEFKKVLTKNGFEILHQNYMPMSKRTKWLCYIVKNNE